MRNKEDLNVSNWGHTAFILLLLVGCAAPQGPQIESVPNSSSPVVPGEQGEVLRVPSRTFPHDSFDSFLKRHVDQAGLINYAKALNERDELNLYLQQIASVSPDSDPALFPTEEDRLAYWLNAYNASVIDLVLDHYPIASVQDLRAPLLLRFLPEGAGFFVFERITLGKKRTRLYSLENSLIRKRFDDPRIHFALNCASASCPRLPAEAFRADRLEEQLRRETLGFLGDPRNVEVDPAAQTIRLSAIFDWYEKDFRTGLRTFLITEGSPELADQLRNCSECDFTFNAYDWSLNDRSGN